MRALEPWKVLSDTTLLERRWLRLREQHVRLSNGHEIEQFHVVDGPDWAAALAITPDDQVVMVRQYRHGTGELSLELPAGVIEPDEPSEQAAQRELLEETGYVADSWQPLMVLNPEPARHSNRAHVFVAQGARLSAQATPEPSEELQIELHPVKALDSLMRSGRSLTAFTSA
ncbi:MAG: NUDIX hydrolase [Polyangiaceae bacterium]